jgi:uncharacterized protein (TIGR03382 family)
MLLVSAAALAASLLLPRPGSFVVSGPAGLLLFVLAAGTSAADAVPLRRLPLACSLLSLPASALIAAAQLTPLDHPAPPAAAVLALQALAWLGPRRADKLPHR